MNPDKVRHGYFDRKIAQGMLDRGHVVRVVFEEVNNIAVVITVYPAERRRYRV